VTERRLRANGLAFNLAEAGDGPQVLDPDLDRQLADLSRPGALVVGLNWYRANIDRPPSSSTIRPGSPSRP
jgi:hypothetical protein